MEMKPIKTETDYQVALKEIECLFASCLIEKCYRWG